MAKIVKTRLLKELTKYCLEPRLFLSIKDTNEEVSEHIPQSWWPLLSLGEVNPERLLDLWQPVSANLPMTMDSLSERLCGLAILEEADDLPSLLYIFITQSGHFSFYKGKIPIERRDIPEKLREPWQLMPEEFRKLYSIHNGWYLLSTMSSGYFPIKNWQWLTLRDWGLDAETIDILPFDINRTIFVHHNGGPGYLGFELMGDNHKGKVRPVRWWANDPQASAVNIKFLEELDFAIFGRLEDFKSFEETL
jgi:hypothetical protein